MIIRKLRMVHCYAGGHLVHRKQEYRGDVVRCMVSILGSPVSVSDTQMPFPSLHIGDV